MFEDIIDERKSTKGFYRNRYRFFSQALFYTLIIIFAETLLLLATYLLQPEPKYYASSSDGQLNEVKLAHRGASLPEPPLPALLSDQPPKG